MKFSKVKKISRTKKRMYDITVLNNHNFFINEHLIHNCDYRGELKIILFNLSQEPFIINNGDRIAQGVVNEVCKFPMVEVDELPSTERGEGGFGSTGK